METTRILNPPRTVDPYYHQAERMAALESRITLLEGNGARTGKYAKTFSAATSGVLIPKIDGNNITGVRISGSLKLNGAGAAPFVRLKPNGLSTITAASQWQRAYFQTPNAVVDTVFGANSAAGAPGLGVARGDWAVTTQTVAFHGVLFTPTSVGRRHWLGVATSQDLTVSQNNYLSARVFAWWDDISTGITSLTLSVDSGTMTGRVAVEILP